MKLQKTTKSTNFLFFLILVIVLVSMPIAFAGKVEASATYKLGDNVTGVLDGTTLTVSGTGATYDTFDSSQLSSNISTIVMENGVTSIGNRLFYGLDELITVNMADSVTSIGNYGFARCSSLNSIKFSENLVSIGEGAFYECDGPTELVLPEGLKIIGDYAFESASGISSIFIPHTVTGISHYAFRNISNLSQVVCLAEFVGLGNGIFQNSGTSVSPSEPKTIYGYTGFSIGTATSGYTQGPLLKINVGTYVDGTVAGDTHYVYGTGETNLSFSGSPFAGLPGIENIVIGRGVTTIGGQMFAGLNSVESITIPTNITTIRNSAFANMLVLGEITYLYEGDGDVHEDAFKDIGTNPITLNIHSSNISAAIAARNAGVANFTINLTDNPLYITHELAADTHSAVVTIHASSPELRGIRFKLNNGEWTDYSSPFTIEENVTITAMANYGFVFDEISNPYGILGIVPLTQPTTEPTNNTPTQSESTASTTGATAASETTSDHTTVGSTTATATAAANNEAVSDAENVKTGESTTYVWLGISLLGLAGFACFYKRKLIKADNS